MINESIASARLGMLSYLTQDFEIYRRPVEASSDPTVQSNSRGGIVQNYAGGALGGRVKVLDIKGLLQTPAKSSQGDSTDEGLEYSAETFEIITPYNANIQRDDVVKMTSTGDMFEILNIQRNTNQLCQHLVVNYYEN